MKRIKWILIVAVFIFLISSLFSGCVHNGQFFSDSIIHDGLNRTFTVYIPPSLDSNSQTYPLVIALHGAGSNGTVMIGTALLVTKAIREKFIVVAPDALPHPYVTYFNAGEYYENLTDHTDDVGFISKLIDEMIANYPVDLTRVYVMGHSNGGIMAYRIAAQIPDKIAAIASNSGPMVYEYPPIAPVPIIHMHGLEDNLIDYNGTVLNGVIVPPVDEVMETWRLVNGCGENPVQIYYDNDPGSYGEIIGKKWVSADGKHDIVLYTFEKGGHGWRYKEDGLSATDYFWDFLKLHTLTT